MVLPRLFGEEQEEEEEEQAAAPSANAAEYAQHRK